MHRKAEEASEVEVEFETERRGIRGFPLQLPKVEQMKGTGKDVIHQYFSLPHIVRLESGRLDSTARLNQTSAKISLSK